VIVKKHWRAKSIKELLYGIEYWLQNIVIAILVVAVTFSIGWFAASRYTMQTLEVWYQPEVRKIGVRDYLGNNEWHVFHDAEEADLQE